MRFGRYHFWIPALVLSACGPGGLEGDTTQAETEPEASDSSEPATTGPTGGESSSESSGDDTEASTFLPPAPDLPFDRCDSFLQDCDEGEKCVPFSSLGGVWDDFKCVPVLGEQGVGEECEYSGMTDALDDCDANSHCWNADEDGMGTCHEFCLGSADDPQCPPGFSCLIYSAGTPALCEFDCDPLAQDCPGEDMGCYWTGADFACTASTQALPPGAECSFVNDCSPGQVCTAAEFLPACAGAYCCAPFCELDVPGGCEDLPMTSCSAFFERGTAPPGLEQLGVCIG